MRILLIPALALSEDIFFGISAISETNTKNFSNKQKTSIRRAELWLKVPSNRINLVLNKRDCKHSSKEDY